MIPPCSVPDYSAQLAKIAAALSRPAWPAWVISLISAALGIAGTLFTQAVQGWRSERKQTHHLRTVVYSDLESLFFRIQKTVHRERRMAAYQGQDDAPSIKAQLSSLQPFWGETQISANLGLFHQLDEASHILSAYRVLHELLAADKVAEIDLSICKLHECLSWLLNAWGGERIAERYWSALFRKILNDPPEYIYPEYVKALFALVRAEEQHATEAEK